MQRFTGFTSDFLIRILLGDLPGIFVFMVVLDSPGNLP